VSADRERKLTLAAELLSRIMVLDVSDQTDVLAYAIAAWCYARDHAGAAP